MVLNRTTLHKGSGSSTYLDINQNGISIQNGKFVWFNDASRPHWFSYHWLLDIKHMVIMTYFFRGNPLLAHRLLFPKTSKGSFRCTLSQTGEHIPQPLVDQLWTTSLEYECFIHSVILLSVNNTRFTFAFGLYITWDDKKKPWFTTFMSLQSATARSQSRQIKIKSKGTTCICSMVALSSALSIYNNYIRIAYTAYSRGNWDVVVVSFVYIPIIHY